MIYADLNNRPMKLTVAFCPGGTRPPTEVMVSSLEEHREEHGVEPICAQLPIAPSTVSFRQACMIAAGA